jgi:anti-sigma regulatory factor (Ser/Thr protein kinase)
VPYRAGPQRFALSDASYIGEARRWAISAAQGMGFDEATRGAIALIVTELATNVLRHASRGELLVQPFPAAEAPINSTVPPGPLEPAELAARIASWAGLDVLSIDSGPGMDLTRAFRDGYSTTGGAGTGLGAVQRMSHQVDAYSREGSGTAILSRMLLRREPAHPGRLQFGALSVPKPGETECGDAFAAALSGGRPVVMLADGWGTVPSHWRQRPRRPVCFTRKGPSLSTSEVSTGELTRNCRPPAGRP